VVGQFQPDLITPRRDQPDLLTRVGEVDAVLKQPVLNFDRPDSQVQEVIDE
jgi:hypothetical protein